LTEFADHLEYMDKLAQEVEVLKHEAENVEKMYVLLTDDKVSEKTCAVCQVLIRMSLSVPHSHARRRASRRVA